MAGVIRVSFSAPPLAKGDERPLRAVAAVEQTLGIAIDRDGSHPPWRRVDASARAELLAAAAARGELGPLSNDDDTHFVSLRGVAAPEIVAPAGQPSLDVHLRMPEEEPFLSRAVDAVAALGSAVEATWGSATTEHSRLAIGSQTVHHSGKPPLLGLPALVPLVRLPHAEIPHRIGWINYWSAATVARMGLRGAPLPDLARTIDNGAWVWLLTDEPLDLRRADHVDALRRAYERFDAVGGRGR
jgi:hypothetical protein